MSAIGLVSALRQVELKGRYDVLPSAHTAQAVPLLLDIAHNRQSVAYLAERLRQWRSGAVDRQLGEYQGGTVVALFGALQDKQVLTMVETIRDAIDLWVPAEAVGPRALKAEALTALLMAADLKVMDMMDSTDTQLLEKGGIQRLLSQSLTKLGENDVNMRSIELLVIFGSFYLVGPLLSQLESEL